MGELFGQALRCGIARCLLRTKTSLQPRLMVSFMNLDRAVLAFAGIVVLVGVALSLTVHPWWVGLSVFAGLNMIQAAFTSFCPSAIVFKALGLKSGCVFR
jgi:hypothetical protein